MFQHAIGGAAGGSEGGLVGTAGNAVSHLTAANFTGPAAKTYGTSSATGGAGGDGSGISHGGNGGTADGSIDLSDSGDPLDDTEVYPTLVAQGGRGGHALGSGNAGNGASATLMNQTHGTATKRLSLTQTAFAGNGGNSNSGTAGAGGAADSRLQEFMSTADSLSVASSAGGGTGGNKSAASGTAGAGGHSIAEAVSQSSVGDSSATSTANAGEGGHGMGGANGGAGGNATSTASAITSAARSVSGTSYANGGHGGSVDSASATGGSGGYAESVVFGSNNGGPSTAINSVAEGGDGGGSNYGSGGAGNGGAGGYAVAVAHNSGAISTTSFSASATASGGMGGSGGNFQNTSNGNGGAGGNADALVNAINYGTGPSTFQSFAVGGHGGGANGMGFTVGAGGDAVATSVGTGGGSVSVSADAFGGVPQGFTPHGSAIARAEGTGPSGSTVTSAHSGGGATVDVWANTSAPIASTSIGEGRAAASEAFPNVSLADGLQAASYVVGMPLAGDVTAKVAGNPHATQMVGGGANVLGLMLLGGAYSDSGSGASKTYVSSATFKVNLTQISSFQDLQLAALDASMDGDGFDSLQLEVVREGTTVLNETYSDAATTVDIFNDFVFNLDDIETGIMDNMLDVTVKLSLTTDDLDAGFNSLFILANSPLAALDGDFNNDGKVDAADYVVWRKGLGTTYTQSDFYLWRSQFGEMIPGAGGGTGGSSTAVPEPATVAILISFCGIASSIRRRFRQACG
jgi:hypothetical protein